jgi:hypothetical protein
MDLLLEQELKILAVVVVLVDIPFGEMVATVVPVSSSLLTHHNK